MPTIIISMALLAIVALAIRQVYKTRKSGGCGCGCEGCNAACHMEPQKK